MIITYHIKRYRKLSAKTYSKKTPSFVRSIYNSIGFDSSDVLEEIHASSRKTLVYKRHFSPPGLPWEPIVIVPGNQVDNPDFQISLHLGEEIWKITTRLITKRDRKTDWYKKMRADKDGNLWMKPGTLWPV